MTTQPEALRLADRLESDFIRSQTMLDAAAELRRLHEENAELREANETFGRWHWWVDRMAALEQQRNSLLEVLRLFAGENKTHTEAARLAAARAAIKAVEEQK